MYSKHLIYKVFNGITIHSKHLLANPYKFVNYWNNQAINIDKKVFIKNIKKVYLFSIDYVMMMSCLLIERQIMRLE